MVERTIRKKNVRNNRSRYGKHIRKYKRLRITTRKRRYNKRRNNKTINKKNKKNKVDRRRGRHKRTINKKNRRKALIGGGVTDDLIRSVLELTARSPLVMIRRSPCGSPLRRAHLSI